MLHRRIMLIALASVALPARAEDKVALGPVPVWVVPVQPPTEGPADGAVRNRLFDVQQRFDDTGVHTMVHGWTKVLKPEGLQYAGAVVLTWQPQFGAAIVHRVVLHRGDQTIDVLKDGSAFTVLRREEQLALMTDGVVTAAMQVPDVRVGDELEFSYTIDRANPLLRGHIEHEASFVNPAITADRFYLRASWPTNRAVKVRLGNLLPRPTESTSGGERVLTVDKKDYVSPSIAAGAPGRFTEEGAYQASDFTSWGVVRDVMAPLYEEAARIVPGSPLDTEVKRIAALSTDPKVRATEALHSVQGAVRYYAKAEGLGGYQPQPAEAVWAARSGDCKGKTVLLTAMLRALGIDAVPVLVSADRGDGLDRALPMPGRFNHVFVRATTGGKTYWLDGTRQGDRIVDDVDVPDFRWVLPLDASGDKLTPLVATPLRQPETEWSLDLDARAGVGKPAKASGYARFRGDIGQGTRLLIEVASVADRDKLLRRAWTSRHSFVKVDTVDWKSDQVNGTVTISFAGTAEMDWNIDSDPPYYNYEADNAGLGLRLSPDRTGIADPSSAPVAVGANYDVARETILLPDGGRDFSLDGVAVDQTIAGIHYQRQLSLKGERFEVVTTIRNPSAEITFEAAKAADKEADRLRGKRVFIELPQKYHKNKAATAEASSSPSGTSATPVSAAEKAGQEIRALGFKRDFAGALARADQALKEVGRTPYLLALRGEILAALGRTGEAQNDFDSALAIDGKNVEALAAKARLLTNNGRYDDALILADRLVLLDPDKRDNYLFRAFLREAASDTAGAIADLNILTAKNAGDVDAQVALVNLLRQTNRTDDALAAAQELAKASPDDPIAQALLGNVLMLAGRQQEGIAALNRSVAIKPTADGYVARLQFAEQRPPAEQLADVLALIKLEPGRYVPQKVARRFKGNVDAVGKIFGAYDAAKRAAGSDQDKIKAIDASRTAFLAGIGDPKPYLALVDESKARAVGDDAKVAVYNQACWERAKRDLELDEALNDCNQSIAFGRRAANLDSRGLVYLQRKDYKAALADYDAALTLQPKLASSLFGRGLAKLRLGDGAGGKADLDAARAIRKEVDEDYADYGQKP